MRKFILSVVCFLSCSALNPAWAVNEDRVALVIGNDQYPADPLKNAVNDAQAVAKTLSDLGFKVLIKTNADFATMRGVAVEFAKVMEGATAAVFFYAGHGIQYRGQNYLVPTDAKLTTEASIAFNAMPVSHGQHSRGLPKRLPLIVRAKSNRCDGSFASLDKRRS